MTNGMRLLGYVIVGFYVIFLSFNQTAFSGEQEKIWQSQLKTLGYYRGPVDGQFGKGSKQALNRFLKDAGGKDWSDPATKVFLSDVVKAKKKQPKAIVRTLVAAMTRGGLPETSGRKVLGHSQLPIEVLPNLGHRFLINEASFSPDGELLVTASSDDNVRLWQVKTGRLIRVFKGHTANVNSVSFAPNGLQIVTGAEDNSIKFWDLATGKALKTISTIANGRPWELDIKSVAYSPDGKVVAVASSDKHIRLYDAKTYEKKQTYSGHTLTVNHVAFSADGLRMLSSSLDKSVRVWDVRSGKSLAILKGHSKGVTQAKFSPDQSLIASSSSDKTVRIWNAKSFKPVRTINAHKKDVLGLTFLGHGNRLVTASWDGTARLWDLASGKLIDVLAEHKKGFWGVVSSPDKQIQAVVTEKAGVHLFDSKSGRKIREIVGSALDVQQLEVSPDEKYIYSARGYEGLVYKWDLLSGSRVASCQAHDNRISNLQFIRNGTHLISASFDGTAKLLGADNLCGSQSKFAGHTKPVASVAVSANQKLLATASWDDTAKIWDAQTMKLLHTLKGHDKSVNVVAFSPDGEKLLTGSNDKTVRVWGVKSGQLLHQLEGHGGSISDARFTSKGKTILTVASNDKAVRYWDARTGKFLHKFDKQYGVSYDKFEFSHDASLAASSKANNIHVWNVSDGKHVQSLEGHKTYIGSISFSPDLGSLLAGGWDGEVKLWDIKSGKIRQSYSGHKHWVTKTKFLDRNALATASLDATIRVWNLGSGKEQVKFISFKDGSWISMTPEGFFNASSPEAAKNINVVRGLEVYSVNNFYDVLYRPDLVAAALAGDPDGLVASAAKNLNLDRLIDGGLPPEVEIVTPQDEIVLDRDRFDLAIRITQKDGGLGRIEYRVNGKVQGGTRGLGAITPTTQHTVSEVTKTLLLSAGENEVSVVVYNKDNTIASNPASIMVKVDAKALRKPELFVVSIGINDYFDSDLRLNHAISDAQAIARTASQSGHKVYSAVHQHVLVDDQVTKKGLEALFTELSGKVRPDDAFLFFIAGHGKTVAGRYYFLPQDFRYRNESSVVKDGLSQEIWQDWFSRIPAQRSLLLYDTCESGSLTADGAIKRGGLERKGAIDRFAHATGRAILTAATDTAPALEGYKGHGIFTYALLEAFAKGDSNKDDALLTTELASYVDMRLPELSREAFGQRQIPQMKIAGSGFPVGNPVSLKSSGVRAENKADNTNIAVPSEPTHIITGPAKIVEKGWILNTTVGHLNPGQKVVVISVDGDYSLVARKGTILGLVETEKLLKMED
ncbi:MAG: caspase family protein [Cohaesibacter sp.]|jgi:WD40 repeat protein|nr:caspase family protein [Cohaesibacter sp.]